jgi:hypothetical protein
VWSAITPVFSVRGANIISKLTRATLIAALVMVAIPASAKSKMNGCSEAGMAKAEMMKMPDGENKTMAIQEMTSAKSSMSQKDMAGCEMHMSKAMKMTSMSRRKWDYTSAPLTCRALVLLVLLTWTAIHFSKPHRWDRWLF